MCRSIRGWGNKRKKGFTMFELMLIVVLIGVALMFIGPRTQSYIQAGENLSRKEKHKLVVIAIQEWTKDNKLNFQKPGDFEVLNSQGRTVVDYLRGQGFVEDRDSANFLYLKDKETEMLFKNGVLITRSLKDNSAVDVYTVFESSNLTSSPELIMLDDFEALRGTLKYSSETNAEYNARIKIKGQKKLLLKEDNSLL